MKQTFKPVSTSVNFPEMEKDRLAYWYEKGIVENICTKTMLPKNDFHSLMDLSRPIIPWASIMRGAGRIKISGNGLKTCRGTGSGSKTVLTVRGFGWKLKLRRNWD